MHCRSTRRERLAFSVMLTLVHLVVRNALQTIFHLLISCLHDLGQEKSSMFELTFYILESLATVKSCVLLVLSAQEGREASAEQLEDLFTCLLSSVR